MHNKMNLFQKIESSLLGLCLAFVFWLAKTDTAQAAFTNVDCANGAHVAALGIPQTECEALEAIWTDTNWAGWTNNTNWDTVSNVNTWNGVTEGAGFVTILDLKTNWLSGPLSSEIGNFSNLVYLFLENNALTGAIPSELGNITTLDILALQFNQFSGPIPTEISNLTGLTYLILNNNQLTGSIPSGLGSFAGLEILNFSNNQLTGSIPSELGNLSNLTTLYLNGNQFSGSIPSELGNLNSLSQLHLGNNDLTWFIPTELGNLINLTLLRLSSNELSGSIPSQLGNLINLTNLGLSGNQLTTVPGELANLTNITSLNLSNNIITSIAPEFGNHTSLENLDLSGNQLVTIPTELGNLSNLMYLYLYDNQLTSLPSGLGNLAALEELDLSENQLTTVPREIWNLSNLMYLYLYDNQLISLPSELGNLVSLEELDLSNNQLTTIPSELGSLGDLMYLYLNNNQITGSIPAELLNLSNLEYIYLNNNQLSGSVPDFTTLSLEELIINDNKLTFVDFETEHVAYGALSDYSYTPQWTSDSDRSAAFVEGNVMSLIPEVALNPSGNDIYQWYFDGNPIAWPAGTQRVYTKTGAVADSGEYTYTVTNTVVWGLTLNSHTGADAISVTVNPVQTIGSLTLTNSLINQHTNSTITYSNLSGIGPGGYIELDFDDNFAFSWSMANADVQLTNSGATITNSSATINTTTKTITSTINVGNLPANNEIELNVNNLKIQNPAASGSYVVTLSVFNGSGGLIEYATGSVAITENQAPNLPVLDNYNTGATTQNNNVSLQFDLSDPDGDQVKYQIQVDDHADYSSPLIDDASDSLANSPRNDETYALTGLNNAQWHWRVKTIDSHGLESAWSDSGSGFIVNVPASEPAPVSSSGGGGGTWGWAGSIANNPCSNSTTPYTMPTFLSVSKVKLVRPLDLSKSNGLISRPTEMRNCRYDHFVSLERETTVTENGEIFDGIIAVPNEVNLPENDQIKNSFTVLKGLEVGATEATNLDFSKPYRLRIYLDDIDDLEEDRIKLYYYDPKTNKYLLAGDGGSVGSNKTFIEAKMSHMTVFAVLYGNEPEVHPVEAELPEVEEEENVWNEKTAVVSESIPEPEGTEPAVETEKAEPTPETQLSEPAVNTPKAENPSVEKPEPTVEEVKKDDQELSKPAEEAPAEELQKTEEKITPEEDETLVHQAAPPSVDRSDTDKDGIPDVWEEEHGLNPDDPADAFEDRDSDGLTNREEYEHYTDLSDADTDNDALIDGAEVLIYHTNPSVLDTDGDGVWDGQEVLDGTDPRDGMTTLNDLDGNGVSDDWENQYYQDLPHTADWYQENDTDQDGVDDYTEYIYYTNPTQADTDEDELTDAQEINEYSTNPNQKDTDGDGLSDADEINEKQTNPNRKDTDGDGFIDGTEVELSSDPADPQSIPEDKDQDGMADEWELKHGLDPDDPNDVNEDPDKDGLTNRAEHNENTNPNEADTDGDGLKDGRELQRGLNPLVKDIKFVDGNNNGINDDWEMRHFGELRDDLNSRDFDADGLSDQLEYDYYTNPTVEDTDGDGLTDAEEILTYGTNPLDAGSNETLFAIINLKDNAYLATSDPLVKGISSAGELVKVVFEDIENKEFAWFETTTSQNRVFLGRPSDNTATGISSLPDGKYYVYASLLDQYGGVVETTKKILIEIDSTFKLEEPDPTHLSEEEISEVNIFEGVEVVILDKIPTVIGTTYLGSQVIATWQSLVLTSSLVADSEAGTFEIKANDELELGKHHVTLYAITPDGVRSKELVVPFEITELQKAAPVQKVQETLWSKYFVWWIVLIIIIIVLLLLVLYFFWKKRKKDDGNGEGEDERKKME